MWLLTAEVSSFIDEELVMITIRITILVVVWGNKNIITHSQK